jgi:hypothetical protein
MAMSSHRLDIETFNESSSKDKFESQMTRSAAAVVDQLQAKDSVEWS